MEGSNLFELQSYLDRQIELNKFLTDEPEQWQLVSAIVAELGEVSNAAKYSTVSWCWWTRKDQGPASRQELLGELIDLLHFLLVGYNKFQGEVVPHFHTVLVDEQKARTMPQEWAIPDFTHGIVEAVNHQRYFPAIQLWLWYAYSLDFTDEEIEEGFQKSVEKNIRRWTA